MTRLLRAGCLAALTSSLLLPAGCASTDSVSSSASVELRPEQIAQGQDPEDPSQRSRTGFLYQAADGAAPGCLVVAEGHSGYGAGPKAGTVEFTGEVRYEVRDGRIWLSYPPGRLPYVDEEGNVRLVRADQVRLQGEAPASLKQALAELAAAQAREEK